jgi:uncharacterized protein (DUF1499 family)
MIWLIIACRGLAVNDVTSGESEAYPELRSLYPTVSVSAAMKRARAVAAEMPGWTCEELEPFELHCEVTTPTLGFVDDVWITVEEYGPKVSRVKMRSASRVGRGDLGANAARIRAFQEAYLSYSLEE